ncbi:putative EF hand domain-containing protein [Cryptosporidium canis]|uniref:ubiquitinyl hydrolase 1 n=1 Tax=Cryptosporidium canis TaxID=195482 RepID=A0ABQ8P7C7_9CRYT|nr:putative EF hand domain-containing protein [Cryptosporidium canis]
MPPIWTKSDFLELAIGANWGVPSDILGCDGGSWYSTSNSARFYLRVLERLQNEHLAVGGGSGVSDLENLRLCINRIRNSVSYISEEFPWSRLKYMYERAVLRRSSLDYKEFHRFVIDTVSKVKSLENEHSIVLPGLVCLEDSRKPVFLLYVVSRSDVQPLRAATATAMGGGFGKPQARYSFSVVNVSGFGTEYHLYGSTLTSNNPTSLVRDSTLVVSDVYTERLLHSAFWISLYRLSFVPSKSNIHYLYTVLLPFLSGKSLYSNWMRDEHVVLSGRPGVGRVWIPNPKRRDFGSSSRLVQSALGLLFQSYSVSIFRGIGPEYKASQFQLFLNWSILRLLEEDFNACLGSSDPLSFLSASTPISAFIGVFAREISNFSFGLSVSGHDGKSRTAPDLPALEKRDSPALGVSALMPFREWYEHLSRFKASFERVFHSSLFGFGVGSCTLSPDLASSRVIRIGLHSVFGNFGQFRLDGPSEDLRPGGRDQHPGDLHLSVRPAHKSVRNHQKQPPAQVQAHTAHFSRSDTGTSSLDASTKEGEMLLELSRPLKIPQFDRLIVAAAISCIADNVARCLPSDFRSPLSVHLTGRHQGPKNWFYVDLLNFQEITDFGVYTDPSTVVVRSMVLDYFDSTQHGRPEETLRFVPMFAFEDKPGTLDEGTVELLMQISTEFGFPNLLHQARDDQRKTRTFSIPLFFTGESREMAEVAPEFYSLRDIFFYLKLVITLNPENHPEITSWSPANSFLSWTYNSNKDSYHVRGFDKMLECNYVPSRGPDSKQHKGLWSSFTGWLTSTGDKNYLKNFTKLTDPSTIINSFDSLGAAYTGESCMALNTNAAASSFSSPNLAPTPGQSQMILPGSGVAPSGLYGQSHQITGVGMGASSEGSSSSSCSVSVGDESDVLYLRTLPALSDQLQPCEVERVFQYLTAPYLRIPLLLQFLADENRINSLSSVPVQHIIWMSILEPWQWSSPSRQDPQDGPSLLVPVEDGKTISTPSGLLFNELLRSPSTLFKALEELMLMALDKDTGSFSGANSKIILFVLRVSVVISNYTKYLIRYHDRWASSRSGDILLLSCDKDQDSLERDDATGPMVNGVFRGFEPLLRDDQLAQALRLSHTRLRFLIESLYLKMLVDWMKKALAELNISALCVLYAHIAIIYGQSHSAGDLDIRSITLLLSALVFLSTHYSVEEGTRSDRKGSSSSVAPSPGSSSSSSFSLSSIQNPERRFSSLFIGSPWGYTLNNALGVPDLELFSIQARTRNIIVEWLSTHVKEANLVLDTVVNAVAMKGIGEINADLEDSLGPSTREWVQLPSISGAGRFVPLNEIPTDLYEWLSCDDLETLKGKAGHTLGSKHPSCNHSSYKSFNWWRLQKRFSKKGETGRNTRPDAPPAKETSGSFVDGLAAAASDPPPTSASKYIKTRLDYNEWFRTVLSINTETEINVQFSLFSLKNNNLRVLGSWIHDFEDFKDVIREETAGTTSTGASLTRLGNQFQSADIASTQNLYWCKLVGCRMDLYRWEAFHKTNQVTFKTKYNKNSLPKGTEWILEIFEPWRAIFLTGVSTIYMDDGISDSTKTNTTTSGGGGPAKYKSPDLSNVVRMQFLYPLYEPGEGPESPNQKITGILESSTDSRFDEDILSSGSAEIVTHSLKEIVIQRFPPVILVFDIVEQGRLYYKQLCHTSNVSHSLGYLDNSRFITPLFSTGDFCSTESPNHPAHSAALTRPGSPNLTRHKPNASCTDARFALASGMPLNRGKKPSKSLVITRDYHKEPIGTEMYIPRRFLLGLIPQVFLETHEFWQSQHTGNIRGYPKRSLQTEKSKQSPTNLTNNNLPGNILEPHNISGGDTDAGMHADDLYLLDILIFKSSNPVDRFGVIGDGISLIQRRYIQNPNNVQTLINLQALYGISGELQSLFNTLQRLDDVSHTLLWSNNNPIEVGGAAPKENLSFELSLDLIELPRLHLSFVRKDRDRDRDKSSTLLLTLPNNISSGNVRYVCEQHSGLYLSWRNILDYPLTCELLRGLPHSVLLENDDGDFFILAPATTKPILIPPIGAGGAVDDNRSESCLQPKDSSSIMENLTSSLKSNDKLSTLISATSILSENIEHMTTAPGQYITSISQTLLQTATSTLANTTKIIMDETLRKAEEIVDGLGRNTFTIGGRRIGIGEQDQDQNQNQEQNAHTSSLLYKGTYILDRGDQAWISNLGPTKHYLYPVHTSKSFVFINSVVSGLHLMLWRFLEQQFESVLSVLDIATSNDMEKSSEERQLWQVFNHLGHTWDCHPDAHACRLKMWLYCLRHLSTSSKTISASCTKSPNFSCTWDLHHDIEGYTLKLARVSANCRLSIEEELEVLQAFPNFVKDSPELNNRLNLVSSAFEREKRSSSKENIKDSVESYPEMIEFQLFSPQIPPIDDFDSWMDISCLGISDYGGVSNINNPISSLWESLSNIMGTLNLPPVIYNNSNSPIDYGIETNRNRDEQAISSGEDATEFFIKFLSGRSSITKMISSAISVTMSGITTTTENLSSSSSQLSTNSNLGGTSPVYLSDWIFIYELLTGQFPVEVFPGESTHIWGVLLTRSLPAWDWKSPSILISILRLLILNPRLALSARMPRFSEETRKNKLQVGTVLKSQESFQSLIRDASLILNQEYKSGTLVTHSTYYLENNSNGSKNTISTFFTLLFASNLEKIPQGNSIKAWTISPDSRISRWSVSLNRNNYNCKERRLGCIGSAGCQINKNDLIHYSKSPILAAQNMDKFLIPLDKIQTNNIDSKNNPIYDLPGMLLSHPISKTTIGKSSLERFRNDIREYSNMISNKQDFSILGLDYRKLLNAFLNYYKISEAKTLETEIKWEEIRQGIMDLRMTLLQLYFKDGQFIDSAISRLDELANSSGTYHEKRKIIKTQEEWLLFWSSSFGRLARKEPVLHFDFLVSQLMSSNSFSDFKKLNLFLDDEDIEAIHSLTAATMMTANRRSQVSNALIQLRDIICFLSSLQDEARIRIRVGEGFSVPNLTNNDSKQDWKWFERNLISLEMKLKNVARVLHSQRHYMKLINQKTREPIQSKDQLEMMNSEDLVALYDPRFLVFEFAYNILLRKDQVELILKLYHSATNGTSICHQMIMGAGKTTVISPLLALLLGDSNRLIVQIVPQALLEFTKDVLRSRFSCIVKKRILKFQFHRNSICTQELYRKLVHAKEQKSIILCHPTSIKSLFLKTVFLFRILRYWNNDITAYSGLRMALKYISFSTGINKNKLSSLFEKNGFSSSSSSSSSFKQLLGITKSNQHKLQKREIRNVQSQEISSKLSEALNNEDKEELYLQYKKELDLCLRILHIFKYESVAIVDEIDMILHPLKSELHWPIGEKTPLDLTSNYPTFLDENWNGANLSQDDAHVDDNNTGIRWLIPWYLIEALLTKPSQISLLSNDQILKSGSMINLLLKIQAKIEEGILNRNIQNNPHLILLNGEYYHKEIKPLLIPWTIFIIRLHKFSGLSDDLCEAYFMNNNHLEKSPIKAGISRSSENLLSKLDHLDDLSMKLLNLSKDWLNDYLPHIFQLVHRVSFGLLDEHTSGVSRNNWLGSKFIQTDSSYPKTPIFTHHTQTNNNPPLSRHLLSIPFIGKDTPSIASEFSHPDIVIGLTILAYRYNGLRRNDIYHLLDSQKRRSYSYSSLETEVIHQNHTSHKDKPNILEFNKWVKLSGGRVRGTKRDQLRNLISSISSYPTTTPPPDLINTCPPQKKISSSKSQIDQISLLWPLEVINLEDHEQLEQLFKLLKMQPLAIKAFLGRLVFPELLEYAQQQLSASGQEIGGDILFSTRIGFSGTPSDLLPIELGKCEYEKGSDGEMIHYLTNGAIISSIEILNVDWTVEDFLLDICNSRDKDVHALIDSGALITGLSNPQVAEFLLKNGLKDIDAVVFIDERDKQMIMLRDGLKIIEISQCGVSLDKRFAFYDHVHSIGQDIKHTPLAKAILTVSKDMVFRDFAQGAYRMRQLGQGQTLHIVLQAQVADLIEKNALTCRMISDHNLFTKSQDCLPSNKTSNSSDLISFKHGSSFQIPNPLLFLRCLCGWLIIQNISKEFEQSQLLCIQSMENIWRKKSFQRMVHEHVQWEEDYSNSNNKEDKLVDVFVEKLSFDIPSTIPFNTTIKDQLQSRLIENRDLIINSDLNLAQFLISQLEEMSIYKSFDQEMEKELEMEMEIYQERELQQEKEQEKQQEKQQETENAHLHTKWAKPSLDVCKDSWPLEALMIGNHMLNLEMDSKQTPPPNLNKKKVEDLLPFAFFTASKPSPGIHRQVSSNTFTSLDKIFLPLSDYYIHNNNSSPIYLTFPNYLRFTSNLYNPAISRNYSNNSNIQQRLNNFNIILEWQIGDTCNNNFPNEYLIQLKEAFAVFDGESKGKMSLDDLPDLLKTLNWVENVSLLEKEILEYLRRHNPPAKDPIGHSPPCKNSLATFHKDKSIKTVDNLVNMDNEVNGDSSNRQPNSGDNFLKQEDFLDFMNDHPWENNNSKNNLENSKLLEMMDSSELILESSYLQEEGNRASIDFEELYQALGVVLSTSSKRCYVGVTLEEAQSIRWLIHCICSDSKHGEVLRRSLISKMKESFSIKIYHLSNTLVLLDEINSEMISRLDAKTDHHALQEQPSGKRLSSSIENHDVGRRMSLLELQAQSIYKFVNSESNFTRQEMSTAVRTLQGSNCKLRKDYYLSIRRCRRRKKENESSLMESSQFLSAILTTPNESAVLQCKGLASRLSSKLENYNITILDYFKALDKNQTGAISSVHLYASLESLKIAPSPMDYSRIIHFIFGSSQSDKSGVDLSYSSLFNISISQESFIKAFSTNRSFNLKSDLSSAPNDGNIMNGGNTRMELSIPKLDDSVITQAEVKLRSCNMKMCRDDYSIFGPNSIIGGVQLFDSTFLSRLKCKLNLHSSFNKILEIPGVITVWNAEQLEGKHRGVMKKNKERISLGQYGSGDYYTGAGGSSSFQCQILEVTDNSSSSMSESSELKRFVNIAFPHPRKFKPIFRGSLQIPNSSKETGIFTIWKPIPPSSRFVSLGVIVTKGDDAPSISSMRCIPVSWCRIVNYRNLPCIGSLQHKPSIVQSISENKSSQASIIQPVSFCLTSNLQLLGAVVNVKRPSNKDQTNLEGSFVSRDQFLEIYDKLYVPSDEKVANYLNYSDIKDRNTLFSRLFWLDIAYSEMVFHYNSDDFNSNGGVGGGADQDMDRMPKQPLQIVHNSYLIPEVSSKKHPTPSHNAISLFGI